MHLTKDSLRTEGKEGSNAVSTPGAQSFNVIIAAELFVIRKV